MTLRRPRLLLVVGSAAAADSIMARLRTSPLAAEVSLELSTRGALQTLAKRETEFVFADIDLPDTDGVDLMRTAAEHYPEVIRTIVADTRELGSLRSSGVAHRYLDRPWDVDHIGEVVRRRYELDAALADPGLAQALERTQRLPAAPSAYMLIAAEMRSREPSLSRIAAIIAQDPALTAKVLKHINSAFFSLRREITTVEHAVTMIGMNPIMAIVMSAGLYGGTSAPVAFVETIRHEAMAVAALTRVVSRLEGVSPGDRDTAFLAGMLHDCGKLVMESNWPHAYEEMAGRDDLGWEARTFGADHTLLGAHLLSRWNIADAVVEAVAYHHRPSAAGFSEFGAPAIVHVAHALAHRPGNGTLPTIDLDLMGRFELWDHAAAWIAEADQLELLTVTAPTH